MISLILEEEEARLIYLMACYTVDSMAGRLDETMIGMFRIVEQKEKLGIEKLEALSKKLNLMHENLSCDNPDCEVHHPKNNAHSDSSNPA